MSPIDTSMTPSKPYLIRAIYEWILDNQMTPHLLVDATYPGTQVPLEFVKDGQIVLNIAPGATHGLVIGNDWISFNARFSGIARELLIPSDAVLGIFTRENQQGMVFPETAHPEEAGADAAGTENEATPTSWADRARASSTPTRKGPPTQGDGKGGPSLKVVK